MCGGTATNIAAPSAAEGLSPRVRGNPFPRPAPRRCRRSIPACAGEPTGCCRWPSLHGVYPRMCGGTIDDTTEDYYIQGLSPRVRGNPMQCHCAGPAGGSIPACAGEPTLPTTASCWTPVYPRVCGGTPDSHFVKNHPAGLSPRVRGNPCHIWSCRQVSRSIPACAGEP